MIIPTVNLPPAILLHALGCCFIGLRLTFTSAIPSTPNSAPRERAALGIATTAIGLAYLATSYMPMEKNAFLYASAPIRVLLAVLATTRLLMDHYFSSPAVPNKTADKAAAVGRKATVVNRSAGSEASALYGIILYDGIGGLVLGFSLGTFSGRIPEYQT